VELSAQEIPRNKDIPNNSHVTFTDNVIKSDLITEARLISKEGFMYNDGIYTSCIYRLLKVFKGDIKDTVIELIIPGGFMPNIGGADVGYAIPVPDFEGFFFLRVNKSAIQSGTHLKSYFYTYGQSGMGYNHVPGYSIAFDGENHYNDLEKDLYEPIEAITHTPRKILGLNSFEIEAQKQKK